MANQSPTFESVDAYIAHFPAEVQSILRGIRAIVKKVAPEAVEGMAYQMPSYKLHGKPLVYFAAYSKHIGFYGTPSAHQQFTEALSSYKQGKGSVQFPLNLPIPYDLIARMVEYKARSI